MPSDHSTSSHSSSSFSSDSGYSSSSSYSSGSDFGSRSDYDSPIFHSSSSHDSDSFDDNSYTVDANIFNERSMRTREVTQYVSPPVRDRSNQPSFLDEGFDITSLIRSTKHDYVYCPKNWTDDKTGKRYEKGYYDENGTYYKRVIVRKGNDLKTRVACSFCGTEIKLRWKEGALPSCPNCGAVLEEVTHGSLIEDEVKDIAKTVLVPASEEDVATGNYTGVIKQKLSTPKAIAIMALIGICLMFATIIAANAISIAVREAKETKVSFAQTYPGIMTGTYTARTTAASSTSQTTRMRRFPGAKFFDIEEHGSSIYVEELGRSCYWHESGNYYDSGTDCYFWLNTNVNPPVCQYWYEGISSDFGDYRWMEYDYDEKCWYIETSKGKWEVLPDGYDTSNLWHMKYPVDGRYMGLNSIYVYEIGRTCTFIKSEHNYYDPVTGCHFYYDSYNQPGTWQYWFEDFRETEGIGWLKYDTGENSWYVLNYDRWYKLPDYVYNMDDLWHIENAPG